MAPKRKADTATPPRRSPRGTAPAEAVRDDPEAVLRKRRKKTTKVKPKEDIAAASTDILRARPSHNESINTTPGSSSESNTLSEHESASPTVSNTSSEPQAATARSSTGAKQQSSPATAGHYVKHDHNLAEPSAHLEGPPAPKSAWRPASTPGTDVLAALENAIRQQHADESPSGPAAQHRSPPRPSTAPTAPRPRLSFGPVTEDTNPSPFYNSDAARQAREKLRAKLNAVREARQARQAQSPSAVVRPGNTTYEKTSQTLANAGSLQKSLVQVEDSAAVPAMSPAIVPAVVAVSPAISPVTAVPSTNSQVAAVPPVDAPSWLQGLLSQVEPRPEIKRPIDQSGKPKATPLTSTVWPKTTQPPHAPFTPKLMPVEQLGPPLSPSDFKMPDWNAPSVRLSRLNVYAGHGTERSTSSPQISPMTIHSPAFSNDSELRPQPAPREAAGPP